MVVGSPVIFHPEKPEDTSPEDGLPGMAIEVFGDGPEPMVNLVYVDPDGEGNVYGAKVHRETSVEHIEDASPGTMCWE